MSRSIWALEKDRERYASEASEGAARYQEVRRGVARQLRTRGPAAAYGRYKNRSSYMWRRPIGARQPTPLQEFLACGIGSSVRHTLLSLRPARPRAQALEEVRAREVAIVELQKRVADGEARLKQQQVRTRSRPAASIPHARAATCTALAG